MDKNPFHHSTLLFESKPTQHWSLATLIVFAVVLPLAVNSTVLIMTDEVGRFLWLFQQAAGLMIFAWPISLPIAVWIFFAFQATSVSGQLSSRQLLWLAPLIIIPITMLVWGAVFSHARGQGFVRWQLTVVHWSFFSAIALSILAISLNRGRRSFVAAATIFLLLFSLSCCVTAGSSVTGDWL